MIPRLLKKRILKSLKPNVVVGLFGARRTGKTFLMNEIKKESGSKKILLVNGEDLNIAEILSSQRISLLSNFVKGYDYLFVDEAQSIPKIGQNLKLIVDSKLSLKIFVTGSSSFDLHEKIGEPLTGRSIFYYLYPVSQVELKEDFLSFQRNIHERLIFGMYPQVVTAKNEKEKISVLESICNGYLLKDILMLDNLKDSTFILNLLRLIAFQIGNDISYSELASNLHVNKNTVMRYLNILEKCYVIFSLPGFSRNMRKEYSKTPRYYFWDNGIRNALIANFNNMNLRDDIGKLWENFCISEKLKISHYRNYIENYYFWRTYDQKEIDLIVETKGKLFAYEFKWKDSKIKPPKDFMNNYNNSEYKVVNKENLLEFLKI